MRVLKRFIAITFGISVLALFTNSVSSEQNKNQKEIILPVQTNDSLDFYEIGRLKFNLPKLFVVTRTVGPDFFIYSIKYPGGIQAGLAFSQYLDLPSTLSSLVYPEVKYPNELPELLEIESFAAPFNQLNQCGIYKEEYELREYNFQTDSTIVVDSYIVEGIATDSFYVWYNYPTGNRNGHVDMIIDDNSDQHSFQHLFANTNNILTWRRFKSFSEQLITSAKSLH